MTSLVQRKIQSPVGELTLIATETALRAVLWPEPANEKITAEQPDEKTLQNTVAEDDQKPHPILDRTIQQLEEYFAGKRKSFDLPMEPIGTEFQKNVWKALTTIPFGETRSYGQIARQIQKEKASRAVGAANGKNPLSIVVPCHRVIGASGKLTGFAGGLQNKDYLLNLEAKF